MLCIDEDEAVSLIEEYGKEKNYDKRLLESVAEFLEEIRQDKRLSSHCIIDDNKKKTRVRDAFKSIVNQIALECTGKI
ncbi:MAG: hypothetical protein CMJ78_23295 [Planctomycetaceae bacterium]|nr:hypothetical protein [Planctomycetaceae bacterium]